MTMKFNAIVGNPPYQTMATGDAKGSDPIYHKFMDLGMGFGSSWTLIHPGRFLFREGRTPKAWNDKMLASTHFRIVSYFPDSHDVFFKVDIKGGIAISYWNNGEIYDPINEFSPYEWLEGILAKVRGKDFKSFSSLVYARTVYRLTEEFYEENPMAEGRQSPGHRMDLGSNVFALFPEYFKDNPYAKDNVKIYGLEKRNRVYKNVKRNYINPPDNFDSYKVMIPRASGAGKIGERLADPIIGKPAVGNTETFLVVGKFELENEANACLKYVKTKFARVLLSTHKVTQNNTRESWSNVPLQDFTEDSDIDWSQSIAGIDRQLYGKYELSPDEIKLIERIAIPMD